MRYLYVLLVLSLAALLWAAMAIARHIRRHDAESTASEAESTAQLDFLADAVAPGRPGKSESAEILRTGDARGDDL